MSSFYESESIKQFTGMQTVSTAEVLNKAMEQNVDILYLSRANIGDLEASSLSAQNKADITKLINEGNYITVPSAEVTIGSWSGTGYIVYDPSTGTNTYIINNNLNGGSLCSWVGLAFFCDIIASVVECTWAINIISLGAVVLGTGLILLTGGLALAPVIISAVGFGIIVGGAFLIKSTGDRLYESTELMNLYLEGNEEAGRVMKTKGYVHLGITLAVTGAAKLAKPATTAFAKSKLGQGFLNLPPITAARQLGYNISSACGRYLMDGFANSSYGIIGALDLLNELSPKYAGMLCDFLVEYGTSGAAIIEDIEQSNGTEGVNDVLDNIQDQRPYREIISETDTINLAGKQARIPNQSASDMQNAADTIFKNAEAGTATTGEIAEAKTFQEIIENDLGTVESFRAKVFDYSGGAGVIKWEI